MNCFKPAQLMLKGVTARPSRSQLPTAIPAIGMKRKADLEIVGRPHKSRKMDGRSESKRAPCRRISASPFVRVNPPSFGSKTVPQFGKHAQKRNDPKSPRKMASRSFKSNRVSASPFRRVDPPFGSKKTLLFSKDTALAGAVPACKLRRTAQMKSPVAETVPDGMSKGRTFNIHTDIKDEEASNLMVHGACTLNISDDETSESKMFPEEDNENIPPQPGISAPMTNAVATMRASRKHMMSDEPRAPLGDLEASDYYASGCDASYITIPWDHKVKTDSQNELVPEASTVYTSAKACHQA